MSNQELNSNLPKTSQELSDEADRNSAFAFLRRYGLHPSVPIGDVPPAIDRNSHLLPPAKGTKQFLDELESEINARDQDIENGVSLEAGKLVAGAELLLVQNNANHLHHDEPHALPASGDTHEIDMGAIAKQAREIPEEPIQEVA